MNQTVRLTGREVRQVARLAKQDGISAHRWVQRAVRQALAGSDAA